MFLSQSQGDQRGLADGWNFMAVFTLLLPLLLSSPWDLLLSQALRPLLSDKPFF